MKKAVFLIVVVLVGVVFYYRERIYLRDPLAKVYRNEVLQPGFEVYQSFSNSVLLEKDGRPDAYRVIVQDWDLTPGIPVRLACLRWLACLTDADRAPTIPIESTGKGKYDPKVDMTSREVTFVDGDGSRVRVDLR